MWAECWHVVGYFPFFTIEFLIVFGMRCLWISPLLKTKKDFEHMFQYVFMDLTLPHFMQAFVKQYDFGIPFVARWGGEMAASINQAAPSKSQK